MTHVADLELSDISKQFGNVVALDRASLSVRPGSIHALLGENGAGKTTLMRIAFGMVAPDAGTIRIRGQSFRLSSPAEAIGAGIGMVHQQFSLVPEMTVAENVALGGRGRYDKNKVAAQVMKIAADLGMTLNPSKRVKEMTASERQKLEIVRTFAHGARTLILDEPTAVLTPNDIGDLFVQLRSFASSGGSVILITHKLRDALEHADEVTVLRKGRGVLNSKISQVNETELAKAMLGQGQDARIPQERSRLVHVRKVLELRNVTLQDQHGLEKLTSISLEVRAGEIVGVAAFEGIARPMLRLMAGRIAPTRGDVIRPESIGFVPEDRAQDSVIGDFSLTENMALRNLGLRSGRINWTDFAQRASAVISNYDVRAPGVDTKAAALSGGNQQKFVLGRELITNPELLILENPTQGLDVHASLAIHEDVRAARDAGTAVVIYSSDLDELADLSDRVIVVSGRTITIVAPERDLIGRVLLSQTTE